MNSFWNGWTQNYRPSEFGYVIHVFQEGLPEWRALCGVRLYETGMIELGEDDWYPDCKRCQRALMKRIEIPSK